MEFEWDETKAALNEAKHGVSFVTASKALMDAPLIGEDTRKDYGERRYLAFALYRGRLLAVAFTVRGETVRIISARKANARERKAYEQAKQR